MRHVSHGETATKKNRRKGRTSLQTKCVSHISSSCPPSPAPHLLFLLFCSRNCLLFPCGSPVTFSSYSHPVFFYYSLSLPDVWVLWSSSKMRFIFFASLLPKMRICGSLHPQLLLSNPQIPEKEKLEFKGNNRIFCEFLWSNCCSNIHSEALCEYFCWILW